MSTHALVLAAGAASRFGGGKLIVELNGRPLIAWAVDAALATRFDTVTVVLGDQAERVANILPPQARAVRCTDWREGLAASLRCGIRSLPADAQAAGIFLGDMPHVSSLLANELLHKVLEGAPAAMPTYRGLPAHPVVVSATLFPSLLELSGDIGARKLLENTPGALTIPTEEAGSITDIDTPDDLHAARTAS